MATIKYKGQKKGGVAVSFPIGVKSRAKTKEHKVANPFLEVTDEEARALVELDPQNFEIVKGKPGRKAKPAPEKKAATPAPKAKPAKTAGKGKGKKAKAGAGSEE